MHLIPHLAQADMAFGQPEVGPVRGPVPTDLDTSVVGRLHPLRHAADAGGDGRARRAQVTSSSLVYAEPCAQHALSFLLAEARQLPQARADQLGEQAWPKGVLRSSSYLLGGQKVLFVGYGAIARRLTELCAPFAFDVTAAAPPPARATRALPVRPIGELEQLLPAADHVDRSAARQRRDHAACSIAGVSRP